LADDETIDRITRDWQMIQRRRGHRHSTDDLLTGWYAAENGPGASRILDLGAGIGSVGLLALWRSPGATLTSIEAQDVSFDLLQRNVELNALSSRVRTIHGDLRDFQSDLASFDLVTGSPPYFDPKAGIIPADSQKAHARFELRGDVRDYCTTARRAMTRREPLSAPISRRDPTRGSRATVHPVRVRVLHWRNGCDRGASLRSPRRSRRRDRASQPLTRELRHGLTRANRVGNEATKMR